MACSVAGCGKAETKESAGFTPQLDTEEPVSLEIAGFMGNFEALDQVINNFNEYYPNVTVSCEQNDSYMLASYVENNQGVDIIMTKDSNINNAELPNNYVREACLDLNKEDIDFSDIQLWICNAESFSGAKKRESKSETFSANPFTYEYMYVPLGEEGVACPPWQRKERMNDIPPCMILRIPRQPFPTTAP